MNDSNNNDKKTSHEANLAKIANVKPRKKKRNSNIYEKFLNRVQTDINQENSKTNNLKPLKSKKDKSDYQSIEADELKSFTFKDLELVIDEEDETELADHSTATTKLADSNSLTNDVTEAVEPIQANYVADDVLNASDVPAVVNIDESIAEDTINSSLKDSEPLKATNHKSKKPLIIGVIIGSLLSLIIVVALAITGILSTSDKTQVSNETATTPVVAEQQVNEQPVTVNSGIESQEEVNTDSQPIVNPQVTQPQPAAPQATESNTNQAITVDDFKEESETTFYREPSN